MNYIAIIGDIKNSKKIQLRDKVQNKLNLILSEINEIYSDDISARFLITLGDEFQGLLQNSAHLLDIIRYIQRKMYPVKLRFGIEFGRINTAIHSDAAIGADGPAYYTARKIIEQLRAQEKRLKRQAPDIQIGIYEMEILRLQEINTILSLLTLLENEWSEGQRLTIWDMEQYGGNQAECAKRMNTTQSTIARRLAGGCYLAYQQASETVRKSIKQLEENIGEL